MLLDVANWCLYLNYFTFTNVLINTLICSAIVLPFIALYACHTSDVKHCAVANELKSRKDTSLSFQEN